jgi:hypothetical protein
MRVLYRHALALGVFGDAYVVPIDSSLHDIETLLGAQSVSLLGPARSFIEVLHYTLTHLRLRRAIRHIDMPNLRSLISIRRGFSRQKKISQSICPERPLLKMDQ